jgi:hypothetical protein
MEGEDPQHLSLELDESEFETNPTSDKNNIDSDENQEKKLRFYQQSAETELLQEKRIKSGYLKKKGVQRKVILFNDRLGKGAGLYYFLLDCVIITMNKNTKP